MINVKRARLGDTIELFNGRGEAVRAEIIALKKKSAVLQISREKHPHKKSVPCIEIILACAVPKGDRFRWLIEKATELGVTRFIPLITKNSVVSPRETKLEKHRQYVIEACKQSGRNDLMVLSDSQTLDEFCSSLQNKQGTKIVVGDPHGEAGAFSQMQKFFSAEVTALVIIVGPEGGFTAEENDLLQQNHALPLCCSPHILRIETAALALSSLAVSVLVEKIESS